MMFIGYFYGIRSERLLEQEIRMNTTYRWFLGLSMKDIVPDHSSISFNRRTRFLNTSILEEIFDEIVHQAMGHNMVSGRVLVTSSTHIKANANKNKFIRKAKTDKHKVYLEELKEAVQEDRLEH
jgi:transposase